MNTLYAMKNTRKSFKVRDREYWYFYYSQLLPNLFVLLATS